MHRGRKEDLSVSDSNDRLEGLGGKGEMEGGEVGLSGKWGSLSFR